MVLPDLFTFYFFLNLTGGPNWQAPNLVSRVLFSPRCLGVIFNFIFNVTGCNFLG